MSEIVVANFQGAYDLGYVHSQMRTVMLLEQMRDACLSVGSEIGDHNASTLENAIALIKGEINE